MKIEVSTRAWALPNEIAEEQIPKLPASKRGVAKRANKEGWKSRSRKGRGGAGIEFCVIDFARTDEQREAWNKYCRSQLESISAAAETKPELECASHPPAGARAGARSAYDSCLNAADDNIPSEATPEQIAEAKRRYMAASEPHKELAWRAAQAVEMVVKIVEENKRDNRPAGIMAAYKRAGHAFGRGKDTVRRDCARCVSFNASNHEWVILVPHEYWVMALTPGWDASEHKSAIERDPEVEEAIIYEATYSPSAPHTEPAQILRALKKKFLAEQWMPSEKQVRDFLKKWIGRNSRYTSV